MKQTYIQRLSKVADAAQRAITKQITKQKSIILFSASEEDDEWTADIYDDIPDFPFYDKYGSVNYAAVKEIHLCEDGIEVTGILKGNFYPEQVQVMLDELDGYSSASLADYIISRPPPQEFEKSNEQPTC